MTVTGQLWYTTLDAGDGQLAGYFNSDGSSITQVGPTSQAGLMIGVDTAAGYYFIVNGDFTSISSYRISDNALISTVQVSDSSLGELTDALAVDPTNHVLFAGRWDTDLDHTGIVKINYDPMTGVLDATAAFDQTPSFLVTGTSTGGVQWNRIAEAIRGADARSEKRSTSWRNRAGEPIAGVTRASCDPISACREWRRGGQSYIAEKQLDRP